MTSIRIRLMLAFLAIALVMAGLSALALQNSWRVQHRVRDLTGVVIARFERERTLGRALEVEGEWQQGSWFDVSEVEVLARPRRPKLRGALDAVEAGGGHLEIYGTSIVVDEATEFLGDRDALKPGVRVEISCSIDLDGTWRARKVRTEGLKASDKIKGIVTGVAMDGIAPDTLDISGIPVLLSMVGDVPDPGVELRSIALAVRLNLVAQDCAMAAQRIIDGGPQSLTSHEDEVVDARTLLVDSAEEMGELVALAMDVDRSDAGVGLDTGLWLDPLRHEVDDLDDLVDRFLVLASVDRPAAAKQFREELGPHLIESIQPLIRGYLLDSEASLTLEVEQISSQAEATARSLLGASAVALVFAMGLGWVVWRSIANPIVDLREAAVAIGQGRLDARVQVTSRDELGVLGTTINRMADDIAASTVSIANLDAVFESMAGGLFVLDAEGRVRSVNRAGVDLLARPANEIEGHRLGDLCRREDGSPVDPRGLADHAAAAEECRLQLPDGARLPVSWSGARLRNLDGSDSGSELGYVCVVQDVSGRKAMEERLRRSLAEKELLLREVHHRVKNNLQVISSLLDLQSVEISDPSLREMYADSQARIRSMALIHQQLYGSADLDHIDVGAYVDQLSGSLFQFHGGGGDVVIESDVESVKLGLDRALSCGLIINELVTNALKHAFEPGRDGRVVVRLETVGDRCHLSVEDDGSGMPESRREGSLGMNLVEALAEQLEGELTIGSGDGTVITVDFPMDPAADEEVS